MRKLLRLCGALAPALALCLALSSTALFSSSAAPLPTTIIVNSTSDAAANDGLCTLREAITSANSEVASGAAPGECAAGSGDDTIQLSVTGAINLTAALPALSSNVVIIGAPEAQSLVVRRDTGGDYRVFNVAAGATVTIWRLTVSRGVAASGGGILNAGTLTLNGCVVSGNQTAPGGSGNPGGDGGGIYNQGTLTLNDTTVSGNTTGDGGTINDLNSNARGGNGGGIYNTGTLRVTGSTISNNTTGRAGAVTSGGGNGGGVSNAGGTLVMVNSTVSGNATGNGGSANAGGFGGGVASFATATFTNCTIVNNRTGGGMAGGYGGGIASAGPPISTTLGNTIVANNTVPPAGSGPDINSEVTSLDYNLIRNTSGTTFKGSTAHNIYGQDPLLGPLADNGGPTQTHALLAGSPALDAGGNALAKDANNNPLTTDQRGVGRFAGAAQTTDIGAFEFHPTLEDITAKTTLEETTLLIPFSIGDSTVNVTSVTAVSDNQTVVSSAGLFVAGDGPVRLLQITPALDRSGVANITVTVNVTGGPPMSDTFQLTVTAVNDAPTLNALGDLTINEDAGAQTVNLSGISVGPLEFQGLTVTASSSDTTLIPNPSVNYTSAADTGSISFAPAANRSGTANITVTVTDSGGTANGGVNTFSRTFQVTVNAVNDAPVNTVPGSQPTVQHKPVVFSAANSNAISVADVDAGADAVNVTLTGTTGTVTLGSNAGLTFVTGDGTDDPVTSFTGTLSAVNAALNGLSFKPAQGFGGAAGLQIVTDDLGHNGSGGALTDTSGVTIDVAPGGMLAFGATAYEVNETGTSVTITVTRGGGRAGAASVNYATTDVTATGGATCAAGVDYISASGTLSWADGENAAKTFTITLCEDFGDMGDETFSISLSGATGSATVGKPAMTTVTIKDYNPAGGVLQFSQSSYSVAEGVVALTVTVLRSGHAVTEATVDYATDDGGTPAVFVPCSSTTGLALDRCDYTRALGTLRFAAGEREKTFQVLISDDSYAEGSETAQLKLSNPTGGAQLGKRAAVVLTITDDSPESAGNPIDDVTKFVTQQYHDFLNRDPDADGLAFWVGGITGCGADAGCREVKRIDTSAAFFLSIEFQNTGYLVERMYKTAFGDATSPNVEGTVPVVRLDEFLRDTQRIGRDVTVNQGDWEARLAANKGAYALEFIQRQRFQAAFPDTMTAAEFVGKLDENAGGVLSADERAQLTALLAPAPPDPSRRAAVLRQVAEDQTLVERERNRAFVLMQYFGYLRRNPDDAPEKDLNFAGWRFWLSKLDEFDGDYRRAEMVKAFLDSDEYRRRFGQQ